MGNAPDKTGTDRQLMFQHAEASVCYRRSSPRRRFVIYATRCQQSPGTVDVNQPTCLARV